MKLIAKNLVLLCCVSIAAIQAQSGVGNGIGNIGVGDFGQRNGIGSVPSAPAPPSPPPRITPPTNIPVQQQRRVAPTDNGMDAFQGSRGPQGILDPSLTRQKQVERQEAPFRPTQFPPEEFRPNMENNGGRDLAFTDDDLRYAGPKSTTYPPSFTSTSSTTSTTSTTTLPPTTTVSRYLYYSGRRYTVSNCLRFAFRMKAALGSRFTAAMARRICPTNRTNPGQELTPGGRTQFVPAPRRRPMTVF